MIKLAKDLNNVVLEVKAIKEWINSTQMVDEMDPETYYNISSDIRYEFTGPLSEKEQIHQKLLALEEQLLQAATEEKYEVCLELQKTIEVLRDKFTKL